MASITSAPHVLIIGAGITGLLTAHGLARADISFSIYDAEDANTTRSREWTMGVHWGVPLMDELLPADIMDRLVKEACVDPNLDYLTPPTNGSRIYDGVDGKVLKELETPGRLLRVSRRKLRALLSDGVEVKYGHKLTDIAYSADGTSVTAHFANGIEDAGSILLGADGPHSAVRNLLFGGAEAAKAQPMPGVVHMTATVRYDSADIARKVRSAHPVWSMSVHPDLFTYVCVQDAPDPEKPEDWSFMVFACWLGEKDASHTNGQRLATLKEKASKIAEPFRTAILEIPEDTVMPYADISFWEATAWDTHDGRVTLAGDAAHPMPPYRGQGLNHAIQDARNFVAGLAEQMKEDGGATEAWVKEYSAEVAKRGAEETRLSTMNGRMLLGYENLKESPYMRQGLSRG